jgi:L-amino acid N-acyltransferase YncA
VVDAHHLRPTSPCPVAWLLDVNKPGTPQAAIMQRAIRPARTATKRPNLQHQERIQTRGAMMLDEYPKTITLDDGFEFTLRPMAQYDEDKLYRFFVSLPESDRRYLRNGTVDRILIESWCRNLDYDKVLPILAEKQDVLIANGTLHRQTHGWSKHIGEIRMTIASEYQQRGIGNILTKEITYLARKLSVEQLMARVVTSRDYVINLFELNGFKQIATLKNFVKSVVDNSYKDIAILVKDL